MSAGRSDEHERPPLRGSGEHEVLIYALHQLEGTLVSLRLRPENGWRERADSELRTVAASIERHCRAAEGSDGLLTQVETKAGRSRNVSAAHEAHEQLCEQAQALVDSLAQDVEIDVVRERAAEIAKILRRHLDLVGDLVYDAAFADTGVGD